MASWFIITGAILIAMALLDSIIEKLPMSSALIYLAIGLLLGPGAFDRLKVHPTGDAPMLEFLLLVAVLVSLFTVGLKLGHPANSSPAVSGDCRCCWRVRPC